MAEITKTLSVSEMYFRTSLTSAYAGVLQKLQDTLLGENTGQAAAVPLVAVKSASEGSAGSSKLPRSVCFKKCVLVTYPICPRLGIVGDVYLRNKRWLPTKTVAKTDPNPLARVCVFDCWLT